MIKDFDLEQAIIALQSGQDLTGKGGFLTLLIKQTTETALKGELEQHLEDDDRGQEYSQWYLYRNFYNFKKVCVHSQILR